VKLACASLQGIKGCFGFGKKSGSLCMLTSGSRETRISGLPACLLDCLLKYLFNFKASKKIKKWLKALI